MRAATLALAALALLAPTADAATCRGGTTATQLGENTRVTSTRGMGCAQARSVVRTHAVHAGPKAFRRNGRFELGSYRCVTYSKRGTSYRARCTRGARQFRVAYRTAG
jgi:hypothetical protein